ncbi:MAG TPA: DUF456 domain-containing protein [Herpetosiphonaceae bacterium]
MSGALLIALIIMALGLAGSVLPLVPGPPVIWLGALFYAHQTGYQTVGWGTLLALFALMLAAVTSDFWVGAVRNRREGASLLATLLSTVGGIAGLLLASIPGMLIGSLLGMLLPDWRRWREPGHVVKISWRTIKNWLIGAAVQIALGVAMIGLFLVRLAIG